MKNIIGLIILILGGLSAISPEAAWNLEIGWKVRDAKPSDAYLLYIRITGIIACVIGLILIFSW
ncbi:DUF6199 family natural product biosynthesis protein [Lutispora thermophila]|uniref:DUF6199 domain-containing protein n=1 Tax=Lutispora thermophila DSM 19022 TaxID=1122184 RepID=A0A1M6IBY5_9FIRM|nr:DUF6199 family natural product biosynthesis protein [Lutispora thermophila]SHJ31982.1 hypothetical protein SAMN02745176_03183 [Lutispora thermophila DSM 19022]